MISDKIDENAIKICQVLKNHGYQSFITGECIRSLINNQIPEKYNISTDALPEQISNIFPEFKKNINYKISTFKNELGHSDHRHADQINYVKDIYLDLSIKNFTINAIAYNPLNDQILDPFNGINDINNKIIKTVKIGFENFNNNILSIFDAIKIVANENFTIEHTTMTAMAVSSYLIDDLPKEIIKNELIKTLQCNKASQALQILKNIDAIQYILPLNINDQEFEKELNSIDKCIDIYSKIAIFFLNENQININKYLKYMAFSNKEINNILLNINILNILKNQNNNLNIKQGLCYIKEHSCNYYQCLNQFIKFVEAIERDDLSKNIKSHLNDLIITRSELKISGDDLKNIGLTPGPSFKEILNIAYQEVFIHPEHNNKDYLINFVKQTFPKQ